MKIVVIGGSGLIGAKAVSDLRQRGHEVVAASPSTGVNTLTGEGLAEALTGAQVVVDVANSPSFEDKPALDFFEMSGRNLLAAEKAAGVKHHVALSVVGTDRLTGSGPGSLSGYFRAKMAQENLIKASGTPFTIVHATQFFEFVKNIAQSSTDGSTVRLSSVLMQPILSDDVAAAVADVAVGRPINGMVEVAGPDRIRQDELVRQYLDASGDPRKVVTDDNAGYYGIEVNDQSLVPGANARLAPTHFKDWLSRSTPK
ncbi:MAG TPA: SDR family oxidoreductase [Terriglobales bacterium]|nr:SDR family oxidoreductase [Terriglobales bacterium]